MATDDWNYDEALKRWGTDEWSDEDHRRATAYEENEHGEKLTDEQRSQASLAACSGTDVDSTEEELPPYEEWSVLALRNEVMARNRYRSERGAEPLPANGGKPALISRLVADDDENAKSDEDL